MRIYILLLLFGISYASDNTPLSDLYLEVDPSDKSFDWEDTYCPPGYFRTIDKTGNENCLLCNLSFFKSRYTQTNLDENIPVKYRHGKCCINSHHRICEKLKESFLQCTEACPKCPHTGLVPTPKPIPVVYSLPIADDSEVQNQTNITN